MSFQQFKDPFSGQVRADMIIYVDDEGMTWTVPEGHRFWDAYQTWLSQGNTPLAAS